MGHGSQALTAPWKSLPYLKAAPANAQNSSQPGKVYNFKLLFFSIS